MHPILLQNNYQKPNYLWQTGRSTIEIGDLVYKNPDANIDVLPNRFAASLSTNGLEWMSYNFVTDEEALEVYSHYFLAEGNCVCTGLGLGVRETWLLRNPKVKSITVIEKNENVIEFHRRFNKEMVDQITIIHDDATNYKGFCDTLLLDHYVYPLQDVIENVKKVVKNISFRKMWFWPLEDYIVSNATHNSYFEFYEHIRKNELTLLPNIDAYELYLFIETWFPTFATRERRRILQTS